jgi:MoxR-like ATPase
MPVGEAVVEAILDLVRACRPDGEEAPDIVKILRRMGPGAARGAGADADGSGARAARRSARAVGGRRGGAGRPVLTHRMALTFAARAEGAELSQVIDEVTAR